VNTLAIVARATQDGSTVPVGDLLNIPSGDLVQGEAKELCQDGHIPKNIPKFGGHVVTIKLRKITVLVADQFLGFLGDFARFTNQTED
jgi:hypothetical protein